MLLHTPEHGALAWIYTKHYFSWPCKLLKLMINGYRMVPFKLLLRGAILVVIMWCQLSGYWVVPLKWLCGAI